MALTSDGTVSPDESARAIAPKTSVPYDAIADCFIDKNVVPFLGAAASFVGATPPGLPSGAELARILAKKSSYPGPSSDPLAKIAQYVEEISNDRDFLLRYITDTFGERIPTTYGSAVTRFLATLPTVARPELIITTNYDTLVERTLATANVPYFAISHVMRRDTKYFGRYVFHDGSSTSVVPVTRTQLEETLASEGNENRVIVYKIHGTSSGGQLLDSIVLTETDYVDFLADEMLKRIPTRILEILGRSSLLCLGYSLVDWNFRVLLQRLYNLQLRGGLKRKKHWACMLSDDTVEYQLWNKRNVAIYFESLDVFLTNLSESIATAAR